MPDMSLICTKCGSHGHEEDDCFMSSALAHSEQPPSSTVEAVGDMVRDMVRDMADKLRNTLNPSDPLATARECFLNLVADARRFDEDVDGDCDGVTISFFIETGESQLRELCEALGIHPKWMQSTMEAIQEALDAPIGGTNAQSGQTNTADGD